jgi:regulatory protein
MGPSPGGARSEPEAAEAVDVETSGPGEGKSKGGGVGSGGGGASFGDGEGRAREICLWLLGRAPQTRARLAQELRGKGIPDDVAERVLGRFTEVGLIDDEAFARAWVRSRHRGRGLARQALAVELRRRGVADETVHEAVETLGPGEEERTARALIARKVAATRGLDTSKRTRRLVGVLARKGYSAGLAYRVVREALEEEGTEVEVHPDLD